MRLVLVPGVFLVAVLLLLAFGVWVKDAVRLYVVLLDGSVDRLGARHRSHNHGGRDPRFWLWSLIFQAGARAAGHIA